MNPELPVRSAVLKHCTGGLVVRWVTTSEYPLLYVFAFWPSSGRWSLNLSFCFDGILKEDTHCQRLIRTPLSSGGLIQQHGCAARQSPIGGKWLEVDTGL